MKQTVRGRKRPGRRSDDKTKYARLLAIPAAIVLVLLIVILVMDKKPGSSKNTEDTTVSEASDISIEGDTESGAEAVRMMHLLNRITMSIIRIFLRMNSKRTQIPRLMS